MRPREATINPVAALFLVATLWCSPAAAQSGSSPSFTLDHQTLNVTGGTSSSTSFSMTSCLTHDPSGSTSSASFQVDVGCVAAALTLGLVGDDDDGDGVSNAEEDGAPNGGDGNDDGTADRLQPDVSSLVGVVGYLTVIVDPSDGCNQLLALSALPGGTFGNDPGYAYPLGFASFTVVCTAPGSSAPLEVIFNGGTFWPPLSYRDYGPQAPAFGGPVGFYELPGAVFDTVFIPGEGNTPRASFTLIDGQLGDHEAAGGTITTVGGPAFDAAGLAIPALAPAGAMVFAILLGLVAVLFLVRVRMG